MVLCASLLAFENATGAARAERPLAEQRPAVERVSFTERSDGQGYVVRVHTTGAIGAYAEPHVTDDGRALEWTLYNAEMATSYRDAEGHGPVQSVAAEPQGSHLTLRFALRSGVGIEAAAYRDRASSDLLLGLTYTDAPPATDAPPELPAPVASAEPASEASASEGSASEDRAPRATSAGERWKLDTVVIDAGHGGKDPGATAHGVQEKDVVLGIARRLGGYIEERMPGVDVVYTRDDDRFITLADRGHIANKAGGKLFVSIHANAAGNASAYGTETYFLGTHKTATARKVMERENSVVRLEENPDQYEDMDEQDIIMQTMAQSAYMRKSEELAEAVQQQFGERADRKSRGVKQAGFIVLWGASMPAILVETGFVTNREEARFLASDQGQDYLASAIFRAVRDFKTEYEKGLSLSTSE